MKYQHICILAINGIELCIIIVHLTFSLKYIMVLFSVGETFVTRKITRAVAKISLGLQDEVIISEQLRI